MLKSAKKSVIKAFYESKSYTLLFFSALIFSFSHVSPAGMQSPMSPSYLAGREAMRGVMDEMGKGSGKFSQEIIDQIMKGIFAGLRGGMVEGGEFNQFTGEFGGAAQRGMIDAARGIRAGASEGTKELSLGMQESTNILGQQMQKSFQAGSEIDKGFTAGVDLVSRNVNKGIQSTLHNNLMKVGGIAIGTATAYFIVKYAVPLAFKMIERELTRPKLIIASSKKTIYEKISSLFNPGVPVTPMVFAPQLEERLNNIVKVTSTINTKIKQGKTNVKYRNLMVYGPPGTGKTMFATELAKRSGLEYVFMSGSSFSKFKEGEGIEALDELFAWANKSKGLLIFIDEVETFLSKRENKDPDSKAYQLLTNFLNYTGTRSNKFMLVFATNHKDVLDSAMYRRIDDLVEMPLPVKKERIRILKLYMDKILMDINQNGKIFVESVKKVLTPQKIDAIADTTNGLSGGDLEGIVNSIKTDTDIMEPSVVTDHLVDTIVQQAMAKHFAFTDKTKPIEEKMLSDTEQD